MEELRKAECRNRDEFRKLMEEHVAVGILNAKTNWGDYCIIEELRKAECRNRDEFRKLVEEHVAAGILNAKTNWGDYCIKVKDIAAYLAVSSNTSGSTAKELFADFMDELEKQATGLLLRMNTSALTAEKVWKDIQSTSSVSDEQLSILHFLFGKNLERATRIVDQRGVKRILGQPSGRSIFQVVGESKRKEEYLCFAHHYCACYSFFYDIVNRGEQLSCKHQLAARLAASLGVCIDVEMSDDELALMLSQL